MKKLILFFVALLLIACNKPESSANYSDNAQVNNVKQQSITDQPSNDLMTESVKDELPAFTDLLEILVPKEGQKTASWKIDDSSKLIKLNTTTPQKGNGNIYYIKGKSTVYLNNDATQKFNVDFTLYGNSKENYHSVYFSHEENVFEPYTSPITDFMDYYSKPENQQEIKITLTQKGGGLWAGIFEIKIKGKTSVRASYGSSQNGNDGTPSSIILETSF